MTQDPENCRFHFILNNNERTDMIVKGGGFQFKYAQTMIKPLWAPIKRILIYFSHIDQSLVGFRFFDKEDAMVLKVGSSCYKFKEEILGDDERVIGIKARLSSPDVPYYTDF